MPRLISLGVMFLLILALGATFFRVIAPFLLPLFLAGMTAVVVQPMFRSFLKKTGDRVGLAAGLTTTTILTALLAPLIVGTLIASLQLYALAARLSDFDWKAKSSSVANQTFEEVVAFGNRFLPADQQLEPAVVSREVNQRLRRSISELGDRSLGRAAGTTFGILAGATGVVATFAIALTIYAIALFYFLADGTSLLNSAEQLIPVHADYQRELLQQFAKVVRSVVVATFLAALGQALATVAALWLFGFQHLFVLFIVCCLTALIPLAGTWLVWMPCAIYLVSQGHWGQAIVLALYGALFVGFLDNVIRTYVLNSDTKLHPLLAFISVLGGLQVMGLWGVFIGPIVAACLYALVKIFNLELQELSRERQAEKALALTTGGSPPVLPTPMEVVASSTPGQAHRPAAGSRNQRKQRKRR